MNSMLRSNSITQCLLISVMLKVPMRILFSILTLNIILQGQDSTGQMQMLEALVHLSSSSSSSSSRTSSSRAHLQVLELLQSGSEFRPRVSSSYAVHQQTRQLLNATGRAYMTPSLGCPACKTVQTCAGNWMQ
jgi:hypothetical protein